MTIIVLPPVTATTTPNGWGIGSPAGPTLATVLGDGLDSTWSVDNVAVTQYRYVHGYVNPLVLPANTIVKSVRPVVRVSQTAGQTAGLGVIAGIHTLVPTVQSPRTVIVPTGTLKNWTGAAIPGPLTQAQLNKMYVRVDTGFYLPALTHRLHGMWLEVDLSFAPTASAVALSPADAYNRTSAPLITWAYSSPQNDPQVGFRVAIWKTADVSLAGWVDPATSYTSGGQLRAPVHLATKAGNAPQYQTPASLGLVNGTAYTAYVQAGDAPLGTRRYGAWASYAFTQNLLSPPTPAAADLSAVWDPTRWRTAITFQPRLNMLSTNEASIELSSAGWTLQQGSATIARDTTLFMSGAASLKVTFSATGAVGVQSPFGLNGAPVVVGQTYHGRVSSRAGSTSRTIQAYLFWYDAAGTYLSLDAGTGVADGTGAWTQSTVTAVAPANAAFVSLIIYSGASAAAEIHRFDQMGVFPGTGAVPTWTRGGLTDLASVLVERSGDSGATWVPIPIAAELPAAGVALTTYDTANPPNLAVTYRVFTVSVDELGYTVRSAMSPTLGPVTGLFTTFVLRDPTDPLGEMAIAPLGEFVLEQPERQATFWPLGSEYSVVVSDTVGSRTAPLRLKVKSRAALDALEELRRRGKTLLLQFDTNEAWWVHLGDAATVTHARNFSRRTPADGSQAHYFVDLTVTEVVAPPGLPQELT